MDLLIGLACGVAVCGVYAFGVLVALFCISDC